MFTTAVPIIFIIFVNSVQCLDFDWITLFLNKEIANNPACNQQKNALIEGLQNRERWALQMLDASGRIPRAISQGNRRDEGTYDQCVNIHYKLDIGDVKGKYCYAGLAVPLSVLNSTLSTTSTWPVEEIVNEWNQTVVDDFFANVFAEAPVERRIARSQEEVDVLLISVCIPSVCSPSELFDQLGVDLICQTKDQNKFLDSGDVACLIFLIIIFIFLASSTIYDLYLRKHAKEPTRKIFLAFSVITNGSKIITTARQPGQIEFFSGLKVLSMCWIIMGHRCAGLQAYVTNKEDVENWKRTWYSFYITSAHLAVDTFLFISAVLLSNIFLKTMRKPKQKFNVFLYYLHRYLRLTPAMAVVYLVQITIVRRIASGPLYTFMVEELSNPPCIEYWWAFFLYIQNYVTRDHLCLIHTWYLSMDMQLFIISPLLLLPMLHYGKKITYIAIPFLSCVAIAYTMALFNMNDIKIWTQEYYNYYYATHNRLAAWFIGLIFGAFLLDYQENPNKFKIRNKLVVSFIWIAVTGLVVFLLLMQNDIEFEHTRWKATLYIPLLRPTWALCLCWFSYACVSGNASVINSFLSLPAFQVLSRITYSTYLVHVTLLVMHMGYLRTAAYFTEYDTIKTVISDVWLSYFVGALWTLAFESPMIVIEKILFSAGAERKNKENGKGNDVKVTDVSKNNV